MAIPPLPYFYRMMSLSSRLANIRISFCLVIILSLVYACSHNQYAKTNREYKKRLKELDKSLLQYPMQDSISQSSPWIGTTNFDLRKPNFVIIHHTAQNSCEQTLQTFTTDKSKVSAHYVVCKDGTIHHMLNDYLRAWQAGVSRWGNASDINSLSVGIELDNNGFEPFPDQQISSLINLLSYLKRQYSIPNSHFIGHADIAPGRKVDPSRWFPWKTLSDNGYGLWYDDTTCICVPEYFSDMQALHNIGYDIRKPDAAIQSFKIHFIPQDSTTTISDAERKILFNLSEKYMIQ